MASVRGSIECFKRALRTVFFMVTMIGSLLVPSTAVLVAMLDIGVPSTILSTVLKSSLQIDRKNYSFRSSIVDILALSVVRSLATTCAYAFGGIRCGAYFVIALLFGLSSAAVLAVKACVYMPPKASPSSSWGVALLFFSSIVCALGHAVSAYRTSCQAKRKYFLQGDEEPNFFCKYTIKLKQKRFRSTAFFRKIDKDEEFPICTLTDINSQFMLCKGLHLHYKLFEGKLQDKERYNQSRRQLTRSGSSSFPSTRNSLSREPTSESLRNSIRTPLLSSVNRQSSLTLPSKSDLDFNGWSATGHQVIDIESSRPSVDADTQLEPQLSDGKGVVLVHGFGGGVFSWRHIIGPLARQAGYSVASFDRPGWGLTSRPNKNEHAKGGLPNPYDLQSQVELLLGFCQQLGLSSVVLVGHDDGGLLALMAAARVSQAPNSVQVVVKGVVLIGVSLSREIIPGFARVLLHTSLGRHMLRPLLCSEMASRHAWHDASKLTSEVMDLYKVPLHVEGWDQALVEASASPANGVLQSHVTQELLRMVQHLPALLVAGMQDMLVPLQAVESLASRLPRSKLVAIPRCGHLPPEECPGALLAALVPFITELFAC